MAFISVDDEVTKKSITCIENKFITKYLPMLDPYAVKVYIYALYIFQNGQTNITIGDMAKKLDLSEEKVIDIFKYLEEFELISIVNNVPFEIKILDCSNTTGTPKKIKSEKYSDFSLEVQSIISGRMISTNEFLEYYFLIEEYGFEQNALIMIINYCVTMKGNDIRAQYIKKVAKDFAEQGITTAAKVEEKLSSYTSSTPTLIKIFSALGISRKPDIDDDKLYEKWYNQFGFSEESIIAAAKFYKAKTPEKIDAALCELYKNKRFDIKEIEDYCKNKNSVYNATVEIARSLGVYMPTTAPYVENYVNVWCNYGFELDTLKEVASYCFMRGMNTFDAMNDFIMYLYDEGLVTAKSVSEKIEELSNEDKLLKSILNSCGLSRKIITLDRESLKRWKSWNFSDEMILKAAELSLGKSNPIAYINAILSSWKNDGIFELDKIKQSESKTPNNGGESKKAIIERHYFDLRAAAERKAEKALNTAMADSIYGDIRKNLNSLSIQLAFAEVRDAALAKDISKQMAELEQKGDERLKAIGLEKSQFTPKYNCSTCNDTGYDKNGKQCKCLLEFIKSKKL